MEGHHPGDVRGGHRGPGERACGAVAGIPAGENVDPRCKDVEAGSVVGERGALVTAVGGPDGDRQRLARWGTVAGISSFVAGGYDMYDAGGN